MIQKAAARAKLRPQSMPDADVAVTIGPLIGRVRMVLLTTLDEELQLLGLTGMQFATLKLLADGTAVTAADLSRLLHYDAGSMTRLVDRLEDKRLIRRERRKDDRRVVSLRVTTAGRAALPRLRDSAAGVMQRMLTGFNAAEVNSLREFLNRMIENGQPAGERGSRRSAV